MRGIPDVRVLFVLCVVLVGAVIAAQASDERGESWRVTLETPGGDLPFGLTLHGFGRGTIHIGDAEQIEVQARRIGGRVDVDFPHYDSTLVLTKTSGVGLEGSWRKNRGKSVAQLRAFAKPGPARLNFDPHHNRGPAADFLGTWRVRFSSSEDDAIGSFVMGADNSVQGTFMTTTGDYRYLAGRVDGDLMRLSTFDGAHAFLFHARMQNDGTIHGDFWSGDWWHETWTAVRDPDIELPDMFEQTTAADPGALSELVFINTQGDPRRVIDALDATNAPARIIEVFGTWCPNCADAGRELVDLRERYGDKLGIVGLAFELTDDHERSAAQVGAYLDRFGADWEVLVAGLSNKAKATEELRILDKVRSYPTTIFLNASNEIVEIHTGFTGPATGDAYEAQRASFEQIIDSLVETEREDGP